MKPVQAIGLGALVVLAVLAWQSLFTVHQTQLALVLQLGRPIQVHDDPGLKVKIPFIQNVKYFDKRILTLDSPTEEINALDQKRLLVDSFVRFRIDNPLQFYQAVGDERGALLRLNSLLNSSLRQVLASEDFLTILSGNRAQLMTRVQNDLQSAASRLGLQIVDVRIKRTDLPEANSQAVYRRMQTERDREARENRAQGAEIGERIRADADRQRTIILAEARKLSEILRGEGDAARTKVLAAAATQDVEFFAFYRSLQAYEQALTGNDTTMVLSPTSDFFQYFAHPPGERGSRR
ncbi:MAG: protease modulator HflC [Alphaproteobacteria bacterium]|nr:protease modulator HflC [Alphaproteobacteria bacterium]